MSKYTMSNTWIMPRIMHFSDKESSMGGHHIWSSTQWMHWLYKNNGAKTRLMRVESLKSELEKSWIQESLEDPQEHSS